MKRRSFLGMLAGFVVSPFLPKVAQVAPKWIRFVYPETLPNGAWRTPNTFKGAPIYVRHEYAHLDVGGVPGKIVPDGGTYFVGQATMPKEPVYYDWHGNRLWTASDMPPATKVIHMGERD